MRKPELEKNWRKIDRALEALEALEREDLGIRGLEDGNLFLELASVKERLEELIEAKTRKPVKDM